MTYDRFEKIAAFGEHVVCVMGDPQFFAFELVPIEGDGSAKNWRDTTGLGQRFIGCIGIVEGVPRVELAQALDGPAMQYVSACYCAHVAARRFNEPGTSPVAWLEDLFCLEDPRPN